LKCLKSTIKINAISFSLLLYHCVWSMIALGYIIVIIQFEDITIFLAINVKSTCLRRLIQFDLIVWWKKCLKTI
jgi:hypothetical protein